jgi:hypothetical protein
MIAKYHVDPTVIPLEQVIIGIQVELEHGSKYRSATNVIQDNSETAFRIALAHFVEDPRYYILLKQMELRGERYWSKRKKPKVFLK